jgi:hypothetical protein
LSRSSASSVNWFHQTQEEKSLEEKQYRNLGTTEFDTKTPDKSYWRGPCEDCRLDAQRIQRSRIETIGIKDSGYIPKSQEYGNEGYINVRELSPCPIDEVEISEYFPRAWPTQRVFSEAEPDSPFYVHCKLPRSNFLKRSAKEKVRKLDTERIVTVESWIGSEPIMIYETSEGDDMRLRLIKNLWQIRNRLWLNARVQNPSASQCSSLSSDLSISRNGTRTRIRALDEELLRLIAYA